MRGGNLGEVLQSLFSWEVLCSGSFWLTLSFACSFYELRAKAGGIFGILPLIRWSVALCVFATPSGGTSLADRSFVVARDTL